MNWKKYGAAAALLLAVSCGGERGTPVAQEQFGDEWPLTVTSGNLSCVHFDGRRQIVTFIAPDGIEYALNGNAESSGYFRPIGSIQKSDPTNPPAKKNIVGLIDAGLKLCP